MKLIFAVLLNITLVCSLLHSQDWPQWRGANRDAMISTTAILEVWPEKPERLWTVEVGEGHASPVVAGNRIFVFSRQKDEEVLSRINTADGALVWRKSYQAPYTMNSAASAHGKGPKSTPAVSQNRIVTLGISGILSCYDADAGKLQWQRQFTEEFKATAPLYGTAMSPLIEGERCIVHVGGQDDGALMAVDLKTGEATWEWKGDGPAYASPIVAAFQGTKQVVTFSQQNIIGVDFSNGALLWQIPFTTPWVQNCVTPLVYENDLILSGLGQGVMRVKVVKSGESWTTEEVWKNPDIGSYMSSPVVLGNAIVAFSDKSKGSYVAFDAQTGEVLWQSQARQGSNAALLQSRDVILSLTTDGRLMVARWEGQEFSQLALYEVADSPTWAHPAIFDKKILVKDKTTLTLWGIN